MSTVSIFEDVAIKEETGSYFIPEAVLILMPGDQLEKAQQAAQWIIDSNPQYEFFVISELVERGIMIHWRKK